MIEYLVTIVLTVSSDFRIHDHGGIFVDVREGGEHGRQMTTRNPGTHAEALAFVEELKAAKPADKVIHFEVVDRVA